MKCDNLRSDTLSIIMYIFLLFSNFRAGYVPVNEEYLHKAGIRGRKRFLLYLGFVFLFIITVLNTAVCVNQINYQINDSGF